MKPVRATGCLFCLTLAICLHFSPLWALNNPAIGNLDSFSCQEQDPAAIFDEDITISGGVNYSDGYVRFSLTNATSADQLTIAGEANNTADGAISVSGADVYLGDGSSRTKIGSIDAIENGLNGQPLKVVFSSPLVNAGFETGDTSGWTVYNQDYGSSQNGQPIDFVYNGGNVTGAGEISIAANRSVSFSVSIESTKVSSGNHSLRLYSSGNISFVNPSGLNGSQNNGYGSLHGPYVLSSEFTAENGDNLYLDWAAQDGGDSYEVFGFLVGAGTDNTWNTGDDTRTRLFAQRGDTQNWITTNAAIPDDGLYKFEFVCGTYDQSGGFYVGASLYVDNIRVVSSDAVDDSMVTAIARRVSFASTDDDPPDTARALTVAVETFEGATASATAQLDITPVNDAPVLDPAYSPVLTTITEDPSTNPGTSIATLLPDNAVNDPDDTIEAIAVIGADTDHGVWEFSTNSGVSWSGLGNVSASSARLLADTDRLRFVPEADWNGTAAITLRAWDTSSGVRGLTADTTSGSSTFSTATDGASINVSPVYDPPVVAGPSNQSPGPASAILGGTISEIGDLPVTERGVFWSTDQDFADQTGTKVSETGSWSETGPFTVDVSGLPPGTTIYYQLFASTSAGTFTGGRSSFLTLCAAPQTPAISTITASGFTAGWDAVTGAAGYRLDLSTAADFSSFVTGHEDREVNDTTLIISALEPGTAYHLRVRAVNASGTGASSATADTITICSAPANPAVSSITTAGFTTGWDAVTGASAYRLDLSTAPDFSSFVSGYENRPVSATTLAVSGLEAGSTYYWRARAENASGASASSTVNATHTICTMPAGLNVSAITTAGFSAGWDAVSGATGYRLDLSTAADFSSFVSGYEDRPLGATTLAVSGLEAGSTYYWRTRAENASGAGASSTVFTTHTLCATSADCSVSNISATGFTAGWDAVTGATGYRLDLSTAADFSSFVSGHEDRPVSATTLAVSGLEPNTGYHWRVRAENASGAGASANTANVLTLCTAPRDPDVSGITTTGVTAGWDAITGATGYRLDLSTAADFSSFVSGYENRAVDATTLIISGLEAGTSYHWRVRADNPSGSSVPSVTRDFITLCDAPATLSAVHVDETEFTARWLPTTGAASYRLDVSSSADFTSPVSGHEDLTVDGTSQDVTGLHYGQAYYYRVRAVNDSGTSADSAPRTVSTPNTLTISGPGTYEIPAGTSVDALVISGGATVTAAGPFTVNGTLTITGGTFEIPSGTSADALVINGGATVDAGGPVDIAGPLTITDGTFTPRDGSTFDDITIAEDGTFRPADGALITVNGDFTNRGTFNHAGGTMIFSGDTAQTITSAGDPFHRLTVNTGGTLSTSDPVTVTDALAINDGTFTPLNGSSFADIDIAEDGTLQPADDALITIDGDFTNRGTFNHAGGTVVFSGDTDQTITSEADPFCHLTVNNDGGTVSAATPLAVADSLSITDGTFTPEDGSTFHDINIDEDGTFQPADGALTTVNGDFTNRGSFRHADGTMIFSGDTDQTITSGGDPFHHLTADNDDGTLSTTDPVTVTHTLLITDGTFTPHDGSTFADVTIAEDGTFKPAEGALITLSGDFTNVGTFNHAGGTMVLAGDTDQDVTTGGDPFHSLRVDNAGHTVTVTDDLALADDLVITAGTLEVNGGLDASGDITVNDTLLVTKDVSCRGFTVGTDGLLETLTGDLITTGSIINAGSLTVAGQIAAGGDLTNTGTLSTALTPAAGGNLADNGDIVVDAPVAVMTDAPEGLTSRTDHSITVSGLGVTAYRFRIDNGPWQNPRSVNESLAFAVTDEGAHTLEVLGRNHGGAWQPLDEVTRARWTLDTTPPEELTLTGCPSGTVGADQCALALDGAALYRYRMDYGGWSPATPTTQVLTLSDLAPGEHTLEIIAADKAGNWTETAISRTWTVDPTVPTATLASLPAATSGSNSATIIVSKTGVAAYAWQLDDGVWYEDNADTPIELDGLDEGMHTLRVNARGDNGIWQDGADGHTAETATTWTWRVDTTPVEVINDLVARPGNPDTTTAELAWSWNTTDEHESVRRYRLWYGEENVSADGNATELFCDLKPQPAGHTETHAVTGLTPGLTYYFAVQTVDAAGNVSALSDSASCTLTTGLPAITAMSGIETSVDNGTPHRFTLSGENFAPASGANIVRLYNKMHSFNLVPETATTTTLDVTLPAGAPAGTYRLRVINRHGASAPAGDTLTLAMAADPLPEIHSIQPALAPASLSHVLTITGRHLTGADRVVFVNEEGSEFTVEALDTVTDEKLFLTLPDTLPAGIYDLRVVCSDGDSNMLSAERFELAAPLDLSTETAPLTTSTIVATDAGAFPVDTTLTTVTHPGADAACDKEARIAITFDAGTILEEEQEDAWQDYAGAVNPPRQIPPDKQLRDELGEDCVVFAMGAEHLIRLKNGRLLFVRITLDLPAEALPPVIYYVVPDGTLEIAGVDGTHEGLAIKQGGTVLETRHDTPEANRTTYTVGLLLEHMSTYAAGVQAEDEKPTVPIPAADTHDDDWHHEDCFIGAATSSLILLPIGLPALLALLLRRRE